MRHVTREAVFLRNGERLHQMPAREIRAADVADFSGAHEIVERVQRFLDRGEGVKGVQLEEVDVIGAEPAQGRLDRMGQVMAGRADFVRSFAGLEGCLRGDEDSVASALDGLAEDFLRQPARIDIGGIEHVEPGLETDVHEPGRFGDVGAAPGVKKCALAAEGAGAKAERGHLQARAAELSVFHRILLGEFVLYLGN